MKIDFYTKSVLTVIAVCLVLITARGISFIPEAHAQGNVQDVNIVSVAGYSFSPDDVNHDQPYLPVKVSKKKPSYREY